MSTSKGKKKSKGQPEWIRLSRAKKRKEIEEFLNVGEVTCSPNVAKMMRANSQSIPAEERERFMERNIETGEIKPVFN